MGERVGDESHYEPCFQERPAPLINWFPSGKECLKVKGQAQEDSVGTQKVSKEIFEGVNMN